MFIYPREEIGEWILPLTLFLDPFCLVFDYYCSYIAKSIRLHDRRSCYYERCFWENCDRLKKSRKGVGYLLPFDFPKLFALKELPCVIFVLPVRVAVWVYWLLLYLIACVIEILYCTIIKRIMQIMEAWHAKIRSVRIWFRYIYDDFLYPDKWSKRPKICVICQTMRTPDTSDCCVPDSTVAVRAPISLYKELYKRYYKDHVLRGYSPFYNKKLTSDYCIPVGHIHDKELNSGAYRYYDRTGQELSAEGLCKLREDRLKKALASLPQISFWDGGVDFEKAWEYLIEHNCVYFHGDSMNSQPRNAHVGANYSINKQKNGNYGLHYGYQDWD